MIKMNKIYRVKNWFMVKNFTSSERVAIMSSDEMIIEKETEKAVLGKWNTKFGSITKWIPKSCLEIDAFAMAGQLY